MVCLPGCVVFRFWRGWFNNCWVYKHNMEWLTRILDAAKVPTRIVAWVFAVTGLILLANEKALQFLQITEFMAKYGMYVGVVFLGSAALLLIDIMAFLFNRAMLAQSRSRLKTDILQKIKTLDSYEKAVLREFFIQGRHTIRLPIDHSVVAGLREHGILHIVGQHGQMSVVGMLFPTAISDFAKKHLTNDSIDLPGGKPSDRDIAFIRQHRPEFTAEIESRDWLRDR